MSSQCRICKYWNFEARISVNSYVDYKLIYNIGNIFQDQLNCNKFCNRICCNEEIKEFMGKEMTISEYNKIIEDVLDLNVYYPMLYEKAIIAESKLGKSRFMTEILVDPVFDNSLNRQKLSYLTLNKDSLSDETKRSYDLLKFQSKYDNFSYKYKRIFGNKLQIFALGLMNEEQLEEIMKNFYGKRIQNQVLSFMSPHQLKSLRVSNNEITNLIIIAKLNLDEKLAMINDILSDKEQVALFQDLPNEAISTLLENPDKFNVKIPGLLKLLNQTPDLEPLLQFIKDENPYLKASAIYLLSEKHSQKFFENLNDYKREIRFLITEHQIFIPVEGFEEVYYEILMDNPEHSLSGFLVNYIKDKNMLNKLLFHTSLRDKIKERLAFLNFYH